MATINFTKRQNGSPYNQEVFRFADGVDFGEIETAEDLRTAIRDYVSETVFNADADAFFEALDAAEIKGTDLIITQDGIEVLWSATA